MTDDEIALLREECSPLMRTILERYIEEYRRLKVLNELVKFKILELNAEIRAEPDEFEQHILCSKVRILEDFYKKIK